MSDAGGKRDAAMRFTIDVAPDPEHLTSWVAACHELGVRGAARTPHEALAALGRAVKHVIGGILEARGTPEGGLDVLQEIAAGYAAQRDAADGPLPITDPTCSCCSTPLLFSARQRSTGMCGPCSRAASGEQTLADRARAVGVDPALVLEILRSPEGRAAIAEVLPKPDARIGKLCRLQSWDGRVARVVGVEPGGALLCREDSWEPGHCDYRASPDRVEWVDRVEEPSRPTTAAAPSVPVASTEPCDTADPYGEQSHLITWKKAQREDIVVQPGGPLRVALLRGENSIPIVEWALGVGESRRLTRLQVHAVSQPLKPQRGSEG